MNCDEVRWPQSESERTVRPPIRASQFHTPRFLTVRKETLAAASAEGVLIRVGPTNSSHVMFRNARR